MASSTDLARASSLVGKEVYIKTTTSSGETKYVQGKVDYVVYENNKAYLSIEESLYSLDDLDTVVDKDYLDAYNKALDFNVKLNNLPAVAAIDLTDAKEIDELEKTYNEMSDYEKSFVASDTVKTLNKYIERLKAVREAGVPVIADIKRGDIAKTAEMYAMGHFTGDFESDFVTLAPYMGLDSISPYLPYAEKQGKGMFVLCRTSNGGAKDFEYEKLADGRHVYDLVGDKLNALGKDYMGEHGYSSIGLVIGGTHIEEATEIRAKYKDSFFLIPGYGAQGGKAEDIAQYLSKGNGGVVNSSRGILLAYKKQPGVAFDEAAYNECVNMKEAIAHACSLL